MTPLRDLPRLRPVDVINDPDERGSVVLRDPFGYAPEALSVTGAALFIMSMLDGRHDRHTIQAEFMRRVGRMLFSHELDALLDQLDKALFLDSPHFAEHVARLAQEYRTSKRRAMITHAEWNGRRRRAHRVQRTWRP